MKSAPELLLFTPDIDSDIRRYSPGIMTEDEKQFLRILNETCSIKNAN
jgi:hypothetical protein